MILALLFVSFAFSIADAQPPGGYYTMRYDDVDVKQILAQKRLVKYYSACLLDKGPCTPLGIEFKQILPEAIKSNCLRCTDKQRLKTVAAIRGLKKDYPDLWKQFSARWDPTGKCVKKLEGSLKVTNSPGHDRDVEKSRKTTTNKKFAIINTIILINQIVRTLLASTRTIFNATET